MKRNLLFGAALFIGAAALCPVANAADGAMDGILKLLWKHTEIATGTNNCRQGTAVDGKIYLNSWGTGKVEVWDETGKVAELETGVAKSGTNITRDDAGNIILRTGTFPGGYAGQPGMRIIAKDGTTYDLNMPTTFGGRGDFWGHVQGDVTSEAGGDLWYTEAWRTAGLQKYHISNDTVGEATPYFERDENKVVLNPKNAELFYPNATNTTTNTISTYSFLPGKVFFFSPLASKTGNDAGHQHSVNVMTLDEDGTLSFSEYLIMPNHNACSGFNIFECNGGKYVIYSSGSNNRDGFTIARYATKSTTANEDTDKDYRVATKYADLDNSGNPLYSVANAFYGHHFVVEPASETKVYIYQICPETFIAKYELDLTNVGVEDAMVEEQIDANAPVEYFNLQGIKVAEPENGLFIKRQGSKVTKVIK